MNTGLSALTRKQCMLINMIIQPLLTEFLSEYSLYNVVYMWLIKKSGLKCIDNEVDYIEK